MAQRLNPTRLGRILSLFSSPNHHHHYHHRLPSTGSASAASTSLLRTPLSPSFRMLHSTSVSLSSSRSFNDVDKIDPDTILFEGCDYKHWLIVMDFGNDLDKRPSAEQMVDTYVQTLAKVLGSVEEAKKRMYACSTSTYTGFQAEMDEETSNKFEGMPGVLFILPDSYIDPVNKEYGGDKYINGTIIPRPPPVQYGRVKRGSQYDPRTSGQMPVHQGNRGYNQDGSVPEGRGMPTQRQHPPPNYTPDQGDRSNPVSNGINFRDPGGYSHPQQMNHPGGHGTYVPHGQMTNAQGQHGYNQPQGQHSYNQPQGQRGYNQFQGQHGYNQPQRQHGYNQPQGQHGYNQPQGQHGYNQPQGQHGYNQPQGQHGYNQPQGQHGYNQPQGQHGYNQPQGQHGYNHPQGQMRNLPRDHVGYPPQGQMNYPGDSRNFAPPPPKRGADGQPGSGSYQQYGAGRYVQTPNMANDQGANMGYPVGLPQVENQGFSEALDEQNTRSTENRNLTQTGMNQERF